MPFLLLLNLIVPYVMILVGYLFKKHPVSDIFISLGKILGVIEIILSVMMFLFQTSMQVALTVGSCVGFGFLLLGFYQTDSEIEKKFMGS